MSLMLAVTFTALVEAAVGVCVKIAATGTFDFLTDGLQLIVPVLLVALGVMVAFHGLGRLFGRQKPQPSEKAEKTLSDAD